MSESVFEWSEQKAWAARLLAARDKTPTQVANIVGCNTYTVRKWMKIPDFAARIKELIRDRAEDINATGVCVRENRLESIDKRWRLLWQIVEERGKDPGMEGIPGGSTGFVLKTYKQIGSGENAEKVEEYKVDVETSREIRELEIQAAKELGTWEEKSSVRVGDERKPVQYIEINRLALNGHSNDHTNGNGNGYSPGSN